MKEYDAKTEAHQKSRKQLYEKTEQMHQESTGRYVKAMKSDFDQSVKNFRENQQLKLNVFFAYMPILCLLLLRSLTALDTL